MSVEILGSVKSPLGRALLHFAVQRKQAELSRGIIRNNSLWDKLMFNKIQVSLRGLQLWESVQLDFIFLNYSPY